MVAGVWHEIPALFIAAPLMGTFNSMFQMTTHQTVGRYGRPEDRPANFSTQALAMSAATFLGPLLAGLAIDHAGYSNAFFVMAAFGFAPMAVVWMGLLKFPPMPHHEREQATPVSGWALLKDKELRRAYTAAATNNAIWSIWGFMLPLYGHSIALSATRDRDSGGLPVGRDGARPGLHDPARAAVQAVAADRRVAHHDRAWVCSGCRSPRSIPCSWCSRS